MSVSGEQARECRQAINKKNACFLCGAMGGEECAW